MRTHARLALTLAALLSTHSASAATFWVTNSNDTGPGSLRQAITEMNAALGDEHEIQFDLPVPATPIVLASLLPPIDKPTVVIAGPLFEGDEPPVIIDGADSFRIFQTYTGISNRDLRLQRLQLRNGRSEPGNNGGCLNLSSTGTPGVVGTLTLDEVILRNCRAIQGASVVLGGAIYVFDREVSIDRSLFVDNESGTDGGAIALTATPLAGVGLHVQRSSFIGNRAGGTALPNRGGAIRSSHVDIDIDASRFIDNETVYLGDQPGSNDNSAAISQQNGLLRLQNSLFLDNRATFTTISSDAPDESGWTIVRNNVFVGNHVGRGSVVSAAHYRVEFRNNTVLDSRTDNYLRPTGLLQFYNGSHPDARLVVANNLFGPSQQPGHFVCGTNSHLIPIDNHYNIAAGASIGCGMTAAASTLAGLGIEALRSNGGPVETVSLFADSPALMAGHPEVPQDEGDLSRCLTIDARFAARPTDSLALGFERCDAGSWESQAEASLFRHDFEHVLWRPE